MPYSKWQGSENGTFWKDSGRILWPSPEADFNTLIWEMSSLYLVERNILISEDREGYKEEYE